MDTRRFTAAILAVGTELLADRVDTNGPALAALLAEAGWEPLTRVAVPDDETMVAQWVRELLREHALVVVCGGLGPTQDDVTRAAVARALGRPLVFSASAWRGVQAWFRRWRRPVPEINRVQACAPRGAKFLPNPRGTAPGFYVRLGRRRIAALPGPPRECLPMLRRLLPELRRAVPARAARVHRAGLRTCGVGEGLLQVRLGPWFRSAGRPELGFLLDEPGEVLVKLAWRDGDARRARRRLAQAAAQVRRELGADCVGPEAVSLPQAVGKLLAARRQTLAVAESCTGGLVSRRLTSVSGSSRYFREGVVAYHNDAKVSRLGVPRSLLARHGAVSAEVARAMAAGIRRTSGADWGVAVTGIAGPGGGTRAKPVGLVWLGLAGPGQPPAARVLRLWDERDLIQRRSATAALDWLRRALIQQSSGGKHAGTQ